MIEIIAKDKHLIPRCFGVGPTLAEAVTECELAAKEYLARRLDIKALYFYKNDKPYRPNFIHKTICGPLQ